MSIIRTNSQQTDRRLPPAPRMRKPRSRSFGATSFQPFINKNQQARYRTIYSNEFENDVSSRGSYSHHSLSSMSDTWDTNDRFDRLKRIGNIQLLAVLSNPNAHVLFDSLMKVYSTRSQSYIHIAAICTKTHLYFTSPLNYQIWKEFKDRTKIEQLLDDHTVIEESMAIQLCTNLNLTENMKMLLPYFRKTTKRSIKFNILLSNVEIKSVAGLFGINDTILEDNAMHEVPEITQHHVNNINCIQIENIHMIEPQLIDDFIIFILDDIAWIDERNTSDTKIITLRRYYSYHIIERLCERKRLFCGQHMITNGQIIRIIPHNMYKLSLKGHRKYRCKVVDLARFGTLETMNVEDIPYCFKLSTCEEGIGIICALRCNNERFEWMTHLDYAMKGSKYLGDEVIKQMDSLTDELKANHMDSFTDDYAIADEDGDEEYSVHFNFGSYLNYWERGYENSVIPAHETLRDELVRNKYKRLSRKEYYTVYEECVGLYSSCGDIIHGLIAQDIGVNNKQFNIRKDTPITINHLIALKVYSEYTELQFRFKFHCRKHKKDQTLKDLIARNREIAHWCRYIKECCTFYGRRMSRKMVVYTGLKHKLIFKSLNQHFECPLSTTMDIGIGSNFAGGTGVILKMQRASTKTRYFDVSWLSQYHEEKEKLFMGSSLKIIDIIIQNKSSNHYVSAIYLFEKIIDGQFIDCKRKIQTKLYSLVQYVLGKNDDHDDIDPYFVALLKNMIQLMKKKHILRSIWMNKEDITRIECVQLKEILMNGHFFELHEINNVRQYEWNIEQIQYKAFINQKARQYIESSSKQYTLHDNDTAAESIAFHFEICAKYSDDAPNCALFVYLDRLPPHIDAIRVSFDLCCVLTKAVTDKHKHKRRKCRHLMTPQWLSLGNKRYCGSQLFPSKDLNKHTSMTWKIGLKVIQITYKSQYKEGESVDMAMDRIADALSNNDTASVLQMFAALHDENTELKRLNKQKDEVMNKMRKEITLLTQSVNYATNTTSPRSVQFQSPPFGSEDATLSALDIPLFALDEGSKSDPFDSERLRPRQSKTFKKFFKHIKSPVVCQRQFNKASSLQLGLTLSTTNLSPSNSNSASLLVKRKRRRTNPIVKDKSDPQLLNDGFVVVNYESDDYHD